MRALFFGLAILASPAVAQTGTVEMSWDGCTGPIDKTTSVGAPYDLFISVIGQGDGHKAYDVRFLYGNASQTVPDAWRFDLNGCETSSQVQQDVVSKTCPAFMQAGLGNLQIKKIEFSPVTDGYPTTLMRVLLANAYQPVSTSDPGTRYLLEHVRFDLSAAVAGAGSPPDSCGGFEQAMTFQMTYATYLDLNGIEIPFVRAYQGPKVTFNAQVPARPTSWGSIKSQYRN